MRVRRQDQDEPEAVEEPAVKLSPAITENPEKAQPQDDQGPTILQKFLALTNWQNFVAPKIAVNG